MSRLTALALVCAANLWTTLAAAQVPPASMPPDSAFTPTTCSGVTSGDVFTDEAGDHRNIVGDPADPARAGRQLRPGRHVRLPPYARRGRSNPRRRIRLIRLVVGRGTPTGTVSSTPTSF